MIKLRLIFYENIINLKNEALCDTLCHHVNYTVLKIKSWIRGKTFIYN